jgi:hypothetical protein
MKEREAGAMAEFCREAVRDENGIRYLAEKTRSDGDLEAA